MNHSNILPLKPRRLNVKAKRRKRLRGYYLRQAREFSHLALRDRSSIGIAVSVNEAPCGPHHAIPSTLVPHKTLLVRRPEHPKEARQAGHEMLAQHLAGPGLTLLMTIVAIVGPRKEQHHSVPVKVSLFGFRWPQPVIRRQTPVVGARHRRKWVTVRLSHPGLDLG